VGVRGVLWGHWGVIGLCDSPGSVPQSPVSRWLAGLGDLDLDLGTVRPNN
jgi:hypothetical protein